MTTSLATLCLAHVLSAEPAEPLDAFLDRWAATMAGLETLEVRFKQEKSMKILRRPLVSSGTIRLRVKDQRLRCTTLDAAGKPETEISAAQGTVRILYPGLKRMEVYEFGGGAPPPVAFPGLGGDIAALKRDYEIARTSEGTQDSLRLTPRDAASPLRVLTLVLEKLEPRSLVQEAKNGDVVKLTIEAFKRQAVFTALDLEIVIPPGTTVVRPLGGVGDTKEAKQ